MVFCTRSGPFSGAYLLAAVLVLLAAGKPLRASPAFELVSSTQARVAVSFDLPGWRIDPVETGAGVFYRIIAPSGEVVPRSGYPELPSFKATVAVPPGCRITPGWNVTSSRNVRCGDLLPVQREPEGNETPQLSTAYAVEVESGGGYSPVLVEISGPERLRDFNVAEITVRPFAWDRKTGTLRVTESLEVSLDLASGAQNPSGMSSAPRENLYESLYEKLLLNYKQASGWREPGNANQTMLAAAGPFSVGDQWLEIAIDSSGIYAVTGSEVAQAGIDPAGIELSTLRVYTGGNRMLNEDNPTAELSLSEVAVALDDGGDGKLDSGDRIVFYGRGVDRFNATQTGTISHERHRYANQAVYWLTWGGSPGTVRRIATVAGAQNTTAPSTSAERWLHFEDNTRYLALETLSGDYLNPAPDYWGWVLDADESGITSRTFSLPAAPASGRQWLRFEIYGRGGDYPGNWSVSLGGSLVQSGNNQNITAVTSGWIELPSGLLGETLNTFTLAAQGHYLGWFEIRTPLPLQLASGSQLTFRATENPFTPSFEIDAQGAAQLELYEVTDSRQPVLIQSSGSGVYRPPGAGNLARSFVAVADAGYRSPVSVTRYQPANLHALGGAQYLVIAPKVLADQAVELARMRQDRFSTQVVDIENIYAEYSLGPPDPAAVRNFLYDTYTNWPVRPQLVVLFGDGHTDFRGVTQVGRSRPNLVLPFVDNRDIAVEEWFTRFDSIGLPQIALGRLPVKTAGEAQVVLDKIAAYDEGRDAGEWSRRVVLVADDGYVLGRRCDLVPNHVPGSEAIDSLLPDGLVRRKIYLDAYPFDPPEIGTRKPEANQDLIAWWNRGALLINYLGHGSNLQWAQERVFDSDRDVALLNNGYRLPLVLNSSCSIGHFDDYQVDAMAERLLLKSGGGAIAVFAGTRVTYAFQNQALNFRFVEYQFSDNILPLGMIHLLSRYNLQSGDRGNAERYAVFGDPALILHRPSRQLTVSAEPGAQLAPGGKVDFSGTVASTGGGVDGSFSGVAQVKFLMTGRPVDIAYQCTGSSGLESRSIDFERSSTVLFDGPVTVAGGAFSGSFVLPVSLGGEAPADTLQGAAGLFSAYATSEAADAAGAGERIALPLGNGISSDTVAPAIKVLSAGRELADGDKVGRDKPLMLSISDQSGINTTGRPGEQLTVEVDGGNIWSADLTELFSYERDSYQQGTVEVLLSRVPDGLHSFRFRAVDNALNASRLEIMLNVMESGGGLVLSQVLNYPNPFSENTSICFEVNQAAEVLIRIFTVAGRPVRQLRTFAPTAGFQTVEWDGTDEYRQKVANGVYLYKITCRSANNVSSSEEVEAVGKALLSR